jgi:hypothetical protein
MILVNEAHKTIFNSTAEMNDYLHHISENLLQTDNINMVISINDPGDIEQQITFEELDPLNSIIVSINGTQTLGTKSFTAQVQAVRAV